jgi:hypothetical protein
MRSIRLGRPFVIPSEPKVRCPRSSKWFITASIPAARSSVTVFAPFKP